MLDTIEGDMNAHTKVALPSHGRRIDALLHQMLSFPVIVIGRGPFSSGLPVPSYTTSIDDALILVQTVLPGSCYGFSKRKDDLLVHMAVDGKSPAMSFEMQQDALTVASGLVIAALTVKALNLKVKSSSEALTTEIHAWLAQTATDDRHDFMCKLPPLDQILRSMTSDRKRKALQFPKSPARTV